MVLTLLVSEVSPNTHSHNKEAHAYNMNIHLLLQWLSLKIGDFLKPSVIKQNALY
ncbi:MULTISPECIES: hypothetical protein [unclassified Dysgonomonas]|uniref:hypothetical protein n=1 Tax=unclassified Dysgonomonas TaxID=2630389 RepID=UPI000A8079F9|nr:MULTISPECIES: hypothetical protein [unclassified Dysgonomonas]MBD8349287.1 hypothetical protein [Dysgonomonas sp. HGC4]MBF0576386.1 hypothetical protein [Dysgonomonas sp. GY617]